MSFTIRAGFNPGRLLPVPFLSKGAALAALAFACAFGQLPASAGPVSPEPAPAVSFAPAGPAKMLSSPLKPATEQDLWARFNEYGMFAYRRGQLEEAAIMFRAANRALRAAPADDLRKAVVYTNMGAVYTDMGKYPAAEVLFKRALAIKIASLPETHPSLLTTNRHYARLLGKTGREEAAEALLKPKQAKEDAGMPPADAEEDLLSGPAIVSAKPMFRPPARRQTLIASTETVDEWINRSYGSDDDFYTFYRPQETSDMPRPPVPARPLTARDWVFRGAPPPYGGDGLGRSRMDSARYRDVDTAYNVMAVMRALRAQAQSAPSGVPALTLGPVVSPQPAICAPVLMAPAVRGPAIGRPRAGISFGPPGPFAPMRWR